MPKVVIDPVTRIEGHLRITCNVENGRVTDAWNSATLFRGFEIFTKGRDPRSIWQFAQRICGVCPTPHALASVQATEQAIGHRRVPDSARLVRNIMEVAQISYDHILWFYILNAFDYVNVLNALNARPTLPSLRAIQAQLRNVANSGRLGIFANMWWDHPGYVLTPEEDLELVAHYLQAIEVQQKANDAAAFLGGRYPMIHNFVPGGVTMMPTEEQIVYYQSRLREVQTFVDQVVVNDLLMLAPAYRGLATNGIGVRNYLAWGALDQESQKPEDRLFAPGAIFDGDLMKIDPVDPNDVHVYTKYSFYEDKMGQRKHPLDAGQDLFLRNPELPRMEGNELPTGKYDWTRAVRYGPRNRSMEVGPLANVLVSYAKGQPQVKTLVDTVLNALGAAGNPAVLMSNLGRIAARVIRLKVNADNAVRWSTELLENIRLGRIDVFEDRDIPTDGEGFGALDAPRGALSHYMRIRDGKVERYAAVPASNWNLSPRDDAGIRGPLEEALVGMPVADVNRPLEILRVIHTFDP